MYGGAQLFAADTVPKLGQLARARDGRVRARPSRAGRGDRAADEPTTATCDSPQSVHQRVRDKLQREAVEDFRIDYEDGYGVRPDAEEDGHAAAGARAIARGMRENTLSPFIGLRVKPMTAELHARSLRTLDIFLTTLVRDAGRLPERFFITLPKISAVDQVTAFVDVLEQLEPRSARAAGRSRFEAMVETPQLIIDETGRSLLPLLDRRGRAAASLPHTSARTTTRRRSTSPAAYQRMRHITCDFAKSVMQVALAGTGIWLSDGSTTVMPVPIHRRAADGPALSSTQVAENRASVHNAWRMHYDDVRHSLESGFYQGWDLHPAQLVTRYAAVYTFFLTGVEQQGARLRNFVERAAQATLVGDVFDDAATGQGLLNFFFRAINCGALTEDEAVADDWRDARRAPRTIVRADSAESSRWRRGPAYGIAAACLASARAARSRVPVGARDRRDHVDRQLAAVQLARPQSAARRRAARRSCTATSGCSTAARSTSSRRRRSPASRCRGRCTGSSGRRIRRG